VPAAFEQSFQLMAAGGVADGATTDVTVVPALGGCGSCGQEFSTPTHPSPAPHCGGRRALFRRRRAAAGVGSSTAPRSEADMCLAIPARWSNCCPATVTSWPWSICRRRPAAINVGLLEGEPLRRRLGAHPRRLRDVQSGRREAAEALRMLELMGQAFTDELRAVAESRIE